ncbi:hypothetical protein F2Q69_00040334 [Brassica cretica]|uniref:Uncharacterized protein n=1 Tax=Brassica cretica TaxID=69181 RepID=A0A8S9NS43_BRACR|nr:hypothetical protein F2Q69_00040334 [Brassica cretica]
MAAFYDDQVVFMLQLLAPATNSVVWVPKDVWIYSYTLRGSFLCILAGRMAGSNGRLIDVLHDHDVILMKRRSWSALVEESLDLEEGGRRLGVGVLLLACGTVLRTPTLIPHMQSSLTLLGRLLMRLVFLELKTSPFNNTPTRPADQLVTTRPVRVLLKGEVLGSRNATHINNLHGEMSEDSHHVPCRLSVSSIIEDAKDCAVKLTCCVIHYKKTARILREKIVGMSSEYRYSDDIPTKQVVGNNSSEFHISSEIHRNFPTEFRGNKLPRKFRGTPILCFLGISSEIPRYIPRISFSVGMSVRIPLFSCSDILVDMSHVSLIKLSDCGDTSLENYVPRGEIINTEDEEEDEDSARMR